jgi:hypothetical protein
MPNVITDISDFRDYEDGDQISVKGKVTWVEEKEGKNGAYYNVTLAMGDAKTYFLTSRKPKKGPILIKRAEKSSYQNKPQIKCGKGTIFEQEDGGGDDYERRGSREQPQEKLIPHNNQAPSYKHPDDCAYAWDVCFMSAKRVMEKRFDVSDAAMAAEVCHAATTFFIEGSRNGMLQRMAMRATADAESPEERKAARTDHGDTGLRKLANRDEEPDDSDDIPF